MFLTIRAAAITEIGRVRRANEDRFLCDAESGLFAVADGIGGLPEGACAAQATIDSLRTHFESRAQYSIPAITVAIEQTNQTVAKLGRQISPGIGIGSTLTLGVVTADQLIIGHVGDSCCWSLRGASVVPLTTDQNLGRALAEHFVDHPEAKTSHSNLRALTQCIGQPTSLRIDTAIHDLTSGERILFATDGVTGFLSPGEIAETFATDLDLPQQLASLIDQVNQRGAPDNATAVILEIT